MMAKILSVENAGSWSWGMAIEELIEKLPEHEWVRMERFVKSYQNQREERVFMKAPIADGLVNYFDVTLLQNMDTIGLIKGEADMGKVVCRMGGMYFGEGYDPDRYNDQLAKCGAVIACSPELFQIAQRANENAFMIPNGVNLTHFKPREGARDPGMFRVGFVGNVWRQAADYKGWGLFVKAIETMLVGAVEKRYILHGTDTKRPHCDMPSFFHSVDCLVMPSRGEGCSNTIKEALACGCPVLTTKVGYHGEMLRDGETCLFIERDARNIADTVIRLRDDTELQERLAFHGRIFAENNHDINTVAGEYDKVFQLILNSKGQTNADQYRQSHAGQRPVAV